MKIVSFFLATAMGLATASVSEALTLDITGVAGTNQTTWTFSGSSVAGGSGFFEDNDNLSGDDTWSDIGDYTTAADFENENVTGNATLSIGSQTRDIDLAYIDNDSGASADDFGVGVSGSTNFTFSAGDIVSWTGSLLVTGIDMNDLDESGLPFSVTTSNYGGVDGALALTLNIGVAPVPLPASLPLLAFGLGGLFVFRRRQG